VRDLCHVWWRTLFLINCCGIELSLCDLYLTRDLTQINQTKTLKPNVPQTRFVFDGQDFFRKKCAEGFCGKNVDFVTWVLPAQGQNRVRKSGTGSFFWLNPNGYSALLIQYLNYSYQITCQNVLSLRNFFNWSIDWPVCVCCFVLLIRYWVIGTVPGSFLKTGDLG